MIVVSDSSPLIASARIGELRLFERVFGQVLIPSAVHAEVFGYAEPKRAGFPDMPEWVSQRRAVNQALVDDLARHLDLGEAEAIALAIEVGAELVVLDEWRARRVADDLQLKYTGLVGVLVLAKRIGEIESVREFLDRLRSEAGFRVSDSVVRTALKLAGEDT